MHYESRRPPPSSKALTSLRCSSLVVQSVFLSTITLFSSCQHGVWIPFTFIKSKDYFQYGFQNYQILKMRYMSIFASILCINVALSRARHAHAHQWNHHASRGTVSLSSSASTAPTSTPSVAVAELDSSPNPSSITASSASSGTSGNAPSSAVSGSTSSSSLTPNGNKAGLGGFPKIQINNKAALDQYAPYISWYSDYWPNTTDYTSGTYTIKGIGMVSSQNPTPSPLAHPPPSTTPPYPPSKH